MKFTIEELRKFANSIMIELSDDELIDMNADMVFEWMQKMQRVDITGVKPMFSPCMHDAPMRDDIVSDGNIRDDILANAPDKIGVSRGYFAVPKIMED